MKNNEHGAIEVLGKNGMSLSPETSQQICSEMIALGAQLISETGRITVAYFRAQTEMYYGELKAYIENQTLKSNERMIILSAFERTPDEYSKLIAAAADKEKREELINAYKAISEIQSKFYQAALTADSEGMGRPERPNLIRGIKKLFSNIWNP